MLDLIFTSLHLAEKNNSATYDTGLRSVNIVIEELKRLENRVKYRQIWPKEVLKVIDIVNALYICNDKSVG